MKQTDKRRCGVYGPSAAGVVLLKVFGRSHGRLDDLEYALTVVLSTTEGRVAVSFGKWALHTWSGTNTPHSLLALLGRPVARLS